MRKDRFTDEALAAAKALAALKYSENPEDQLAYAEAYDFARCQRPDGSFYGTSGQCRKGKEAGAKQEEPKTAKAPKSNSDSPLRKRKQQDKAREELVSNVALPKEVSKEDFSAAIKEAARGYKQETKKNLSANQLRSLVENAAETLRDGSPWGTSKDDIVEMIWDTRLLPDQYL